MECVDSRSWNLVGLRCLSRLRKGGVFLLEKGGPDGEGEMQVSGVMERWSWAGREFWTVRPFAWKSLARRLGCVLLTLSLGGIAIAQSAQFLLERDGRVISLVPYAPNIVRVTMSTDTAAATSAPGYGFVAKPSEGMDARARCGRRRRVSIGRGWWCAWRRRSTQRTSCRSRCRWML